MIRRDQAAIGAAILLSLLCIITLCQAADSTTQPQANTKPAKIKEVPKVDTTQPATTEIVIIGTIHSKHLDSPSYSPEVLREIVLALKPSAILNESPLTQVEPDGRPKFRDYPSAEDWASDQVASQLKVPQIPFDRPDRDDYYGRTGYYQRANRFMSWVRNWLAETEKHEPNGLDLAMVHFAMEAEQIQSSFWQAPSPEAFNSDVYDRLMYLKHVKEPSLLLSIFGKYPDFTPQLAEDAKFLTDEWVERNAIMAQNIQKVAASYPGGRLVVLTGAEHRYALRELLRNKDGIVLKEYWELISIDPKKIPASPERKKWEKASASILDQSPDICRAYWQAVVDGNWDQASQAYPGRSAEGWKEGYLKNRPIAIIKIGPAHPPRPNDGTMNPVTPCILKYADGKMLEVRMCMATVNGRCAIVASLGGTREVKADELTAPASSQPAKN